MASLKIKKGDNVVVLAGRDKGRQGEVIAVMPKENRALVRGVAQHHLTAKRPDRPIVAWMQRLRLVRVA